MNENPQEDRPQQRSHGKWGCALALGAVLVVFGLLLWPAMVRTTHRPRSPCANSPQGDRRRNAELP